MRKKIVVLLYSVFCLVTHAMAQEITVTGKVIDGEANEGLPGVNIQIDGTSTGTITDVNGEYSLRAAENASLIFSYIGYETQKVSIEGRSNINITLNLNTQALAEVVVVGYGTQKKSDLISSVSSVQPDEMLKVPSADIGEMLRGRAPGVLVTLGNARPGGSSNILIRGKSSIGGDNNPLVIVDGVPVGDINDVNPNDIASMEILKDAAAQAIYGARASNGVILITTKRGKSGDVSVGYNGYYGAQTVKRNFEVYSGEEFADLRREAFRTTNGNEYRPDEEIFTPLELESLNNQEFIDWEEEVLRVASIQSHNLNISGGSEKLNVYSSVNYMNQEGVVPGTDYQRVLLRLNADQEINDWLKIGLNTSFQFSDRNSPGTGNTLQRAVTTSPLGKIYNDDGTYRVHPGGVQESYNPLLDINEVTGVSEDKKEIMNLFVDISPFEGFNYRINASRRSWDNKVQGYSTRNSYTGVRTGFGQGSITFQESVEYQLENILTYNRRFNLHNVGLTFVQSINESTYSSFNNDAANLPNDLLGIYGLEAAQNNFPSIGANRRGLLSFVGRLQYDYDGKYYVTLSSRADASTVFGANNKWSYFPAVGLGWNVHEEGFLQDISTINNLKLRGSYGSVGNQAISPYQSQSTASQVEYLIDGVKVIGYMPGTNLPNPDLRWETSTTLNLAMDFGIWKSRVFGTLEYYNTRTKDLLVEQSLNAGTGYSRMWTNLGEIENKGIELSLNAIAVEKRDFTIDIGIMYSQNRNKIISLYGEDADGDGIEDDDVANNWFIGQPIDVYYDYQAVGIFQIGEEIVNSHQPDAMPGDVKLYDRIDDGEPLSPDDRVIIDRNPDWFGSAYIDITYKNFDLAANIVTVQGVIRQNPYLYSYNYGGTLRSVLNGVKQDYWTPENPTGNWPRPNEGTDPSYIRGLGYQDASYVRLQNVTLGYSLSQNMLSRLNLSKLRLYVSAQNPLTLTDYQSYSPEKNPGDYPEAISVIGGLQLSF